MATNWPHVLAWQMGVVIVIVEPLRKCPKSAWPMNCQKYLKKGPSVRVFQPSPPRLVDSAIILAFEQKISNLQLNFKISVDWNCIYQHFLVHLCSYYHHKDFFVLG